MTQQRTVFITGVAGFIGSALAERMLRDGWTVVGMDNLNDYYSPALKQARLDHLAGLPQAESFAFHKLDLIEREALLSLVEATKPEIIVHLAAQAGVRYGLTHQIPYLESNLIGHFNMLVAAKALADAGTPVRHFLYASSSSVYGGSTAPQMGESLPFSESQDTTQPLSLYAATKVADELITHAWCNQFGMPATGMRFFTVYGPWGRPDMTPLMFTQSILGNKIIPMFNEGDLWRDFTYIDDVVEAIVRLVPVVPTCHPSHAVFNLGNQHPVQMREFVQTLSRVLGQEAQLDLREWPATEVYKTHADTTRLHEAVGWAPSTPLETGLTRLAEWYRTSGEQIFKV